MHMAMTDEPDYILDIRGLSAGGDSAVPEGQDCGQARKWIGIHFECCGVYTRIYRNREGDAYEGYCPRCARAVRVRVGSGGTSQRMFKAQ